MRKPTYVSWHEDCETKRYGQRAFSHITMSLFPVECPAQEHQGDGLYSFYRSALKTFCSLYLSLSLSRTVNRWLISGQFQSMHLAHSQCREGTNPNTEYLPGTGDTLINQSSGAVWKSRWPSWAPVPNKPTVSVDVKQHFNPNPEKDSQLDKN